MTKFLTIEFIDGTLKKQLAMIVERTEQARKGRTNNQGLEQ